ncbi:hypothetical protein [Actinopolymorpha rutila]|uniref:Peptidase inhibitor family I36 n=1 Tax=Actinopolymorpha rutila TaxID=446787 RepID=A0A852ZMX5_9ACTN|nr:hypothetical protein [Actinopolymorpha rutila]NYH93653.1 hypothetical protein [Actinopolymorpha rutila]
MRRRRYTWLAVLATLVLVSWQAQAAQAATGVPDRARHCAVGMPAMRAGTGFHLAKPSKVSCFGSFAESVSYATAGRVRLAPGARTVSTRQLQAAGVVSTRSALAAQPLVGIEYEDSNYGGDSLVLYGSSGSGCYSGTWYGFPSMSSLGFDNRISSARMYSNCLGRHHDGTNYTGSYRYCDGSCSTFGTMNDRTSSIKFF